MLQLLAFSRATLGCCRAFFAVLGWLKQFTTPIRALGANHRERIASHLLSLSSQDRYLRFGYQARDSQLLRYVESLDFQRDELLGIYDKHLKLVAVAHLAYEQKHAASSIVEFGVSVLPEARGCGFGARLFARAAARASNQGIRSMVIHALSENVAMLKIARSAGARVQRDGSESQAYLALPAPSLFSRAFENIQERFAKADFRLKVRVRKIKLLIAST
jgi:GNAT superfamily N-acetyltransferase